jgi:Niemann-Pick C1 protein
MTILLDNFDHRTGDKEVQAQLEKALEWEQTYVSFMHNYSDSKTNSHLFDLAFNSERSIEDELERGTSGDIPTIAVSYAIMVVYIVFALGRVTRYLLKYPIKTPKTNYFNHFFSYKRFLIEGKLSLSLAGVLLVLISVAASIGMFGFFGVPATLIIFEILPFLVSVQL